MAPPAIVHVVHQPSGRCAPGSPRRCASPSHNTMAKGAARSRRAAARSCPVPPGWQRSRCAPGSPRRCASPSPNTMAKGAARSRRAAARSCPVPPGRQRFRTRARQGGGSQLQAQAIPLTPHTSGPVARRPGHDAQANTALSSQGEAPAGRQDLVTVRPAGAHAYGGSGRVQACRMRR